MIKQIFITLAVVLSLWPSLALAQGPGSDGVQVYFGDNVTLEDGDTIEGGVVVFGGNLSMKEGSEVEGDVVVFGGNVSVDGEVEGNIAAMGGNVNIRGNAVINGDVTALGGNVSVSSEADVSGVVSNGWEGAFDNQSLEMPIPVPDIPEVPEITVEAPEVRGPKIETYERSRPGVAARIGSFVGDGIEDVFWALIIAGLSVLLVVFFPLHTRTIQTTIRQAGPVSFGVGFVTMLVAASVTILLAFFFWLLIPICGIFLVALGMLVAVLGGWAVVGKFVGERVFTIFNTPSRSEISTTFLGTAALTFLATMPFVDNLPLIGWMFALIGGLVFIIAGSTGLGAVVLSRFGTQDYIPQQPSSVPPPTDATESETTESESDAAFDL
jgi:hypothetical protein